MPFYRCMVPNTGGGSGGGDDYLYYMDNGEKIYPKIKSIRFDSIENFNSPVNIGNNIGDITSIFSECNMYNQPTIIPSSATKCNYAFYNCKNFNSPVTLYNGIEYMYDMFDGCSNFNQPITIFPSVKSISGLLSRCYNYNSQITMQSNLFDSIKNLFLSCHNYNKFMVMPNSIRDLEAAFQNCDEFNFPVKLRYDVAVNNGFFTAYNAFRGCYNLRSPIMIDIDSSMNVNGSVNLSFMFANSDNISTIIFNGLYGKTKINVQCMLGKRPSYYDGISRLNIYTDNISAFMEVTNSYSLVNNTISWTAITNGYGSSYYNIYLYNNVQDGMNWFNNIYNQYI